MKRFTDAGGCRGQIIDNDRRAVRCTLRAAIRLQKKPEQDRKKLARLNLGPLHDKDSADTFSKKVVEKLYPDIRNVSYSDIAAAVKDVALQTLGKTERASPQWFEASATLLRESIDRRNVAFDNWNRISAPL